MWGEKTSVEDSGRNDLGGNVQGWERLWGETSCYRFALGSFALVLGVD